MGIQSNIIFTYLVEVMLYLCICEDEVTGNGYEKSTKSKHKYIWGDELYLAYVRNQHGIY